MNCQVCQTSNADDANFCLNCSHRISVVCPRCSRRVLSEAHYCDRCGLDMRRVPEYTEPGERMLPKVKERAPEESPGRPQDPPQPDPAGQTAPGSTSPLERFVPSELRSKLEAARSSGEMVGERRVVTMLFCDTKGSTSMAEQLDPEEWSEIINGAFEHMIRPVYTFEGTVARLMGDGILAFFGAPIAHEDDPHRAVLAGLEMISSIAPYREKMLKDWGVDINIRVGINTGLVVVGAVGSDLRMEYSALGDAINLAARMEQAAEPGTVLIAYDTYKHVKSLFDFEEVGGIEVKGREARVKAYRVLRRKVAASRLRGIEGLQVEMVGRDVERQILRSAVEDTFNAVGRIVLVLGEAGLGKTRLISETRADILRNNPGADRWYETSSLSYERNQAYGLLQRTIRGVLGIGYADPPRVIQKKLETITDSFAEERRPKAQQLLEKLFGINDPGSAAPTDGKTYHEDLLEVMQTWLQAAFAAEPSFFIFDDMHWGDRASLEIIRRLIELTSELPIAFICAMRVDRSAPAWQIREHAEEHLHHRYNEIPLRPLSEAESSTLIERLLAVCEIPKKLKSNVIEKSDGNPFFIEEVVRTLMDNNIVVPDDRLENGETVRYWVSASNGTDFSIPDNLQSLLAARLDRLEEATRSTLQLASVIGRNFHLRVLEAVDEGGPDLGKHVGTLLRLDMIREAARVPEIEYAFRNPLTQEAVYRTILLKNRREFHQRVAQAIEEIYADRIETHFGLLAHHYTLARATEKAIEYRRQASQQAISMYAYEEALQNLKDAAALLNDDSPIDTRCELKEALGDVCMLIRDFEGAIRSYQEALDLHAGMDAPNAISRLRLHRKIVELATIAKWSVDAEAYQRVAEISRDSRARLEAILADADRLENHTESVRLYIALSIDSWRVKSPADWATGQAYAETAVEMAEVLGDDLLLSQALSALASVLDGQSLLRRNLEIAERRAEIAADLKDGNILEYIDSRRGLGSALMYVGEYARAIPVLEEAESEAAEINLPDQIANALGLQAQCYFRMDSWDQVLAIEEKWRDLDMRYTRERVGET